MDHRNTQFPIGLLLVLLLALPARADWRDDIGYTRLNQTFTTGVPTSVSGGVTQAEAGDANGNSYLPDATSFTGQTITNKSSGTGASGHATTVGSYFYGGGSLIPATSQVDAYNANSWLTDGYLRANSYNFPLSESRHIQNHSWISQSGNSATAISSVNLHLDFAINRDGFTSVVGVNNGASTTLPDLLCQSYHTVSVGLANGAHSAGLTTQDGAGRMKPDIVAFESLTSFSTPQVASAAGLLAEKLRNTPYSPALVTADYPRLTKALLLAGAAKEPLSSWSRASTANPYDAVYGAGALNILLSYRILSAGRQTASSSALAADTGWASASVRSSTTAASRTFFFDVSSATPVPFSAALTWHRNINTTGTQLSNPLGYTLANLNLTLYAVGAGTFTLGSVIDSSVSTVDNVEHIYRASLTPGRYALQVSSASSTTISYALAWRTSPAVTVAASIPTARELDGATGRFTVTRTGPNTSPLLVPLTWGGTAVADTHYTTPPATVLIPAGSNSATVTITPAADSLAQGDRTITLGVASDYSLTAGTASSATITLQDKPYDAWRFEHFTTEELADVTVSGLSADPDADGQPNLLEYALGADPRSPDASEHLPAVSIASDHLNLTYTRPTTLADITYTVEWSADLASWSTGNSVTETLGSTDNGDGTTTVIVRAVSTLADTPRQFLRLRATR